MSEGLKDKVGSPKEMKAYNEGANLGVLLTIVTILCLLLFGGFGFYIGHNYGINKERVVCVDFVQHIQAAPMTNSAGEQKIGIGLYKDNPTVEDELIIRLVRGES